MQHDPRTPAPDTPRRGLVLSGGAARGAFQAGVVCALERAGIRFEAVVGASVGAVNGAAILHGYAPRLCEMWVESLTDFRWFEPRRVLSGRSPFLISEAMRAIAARYGDISRVRAHPTELLVSTTDWDTGRNVLFSSKEGDWTDEERVAQLLASLTVPLICSERIVIRGRRYCDGALSDNFPVEPLLARGCNEIVIVDPSPGPELGGALRRMAAALGPRLGALPHAYGRLAAGLFRALLSRPTPRDSDGITVHVLAPDPPLSYASFDFGARDAIRAALAQGLEAGERLAARLRKPAAEEAAGAAGAATAA